MECPLGGRWRKITVMTSSRKKVGATGGGKAARWKSQKADFPTSLGNPANPAVAVGMRITPHPHAGSD